MRSLCTNAKGKTHLAEAVATTAHCAFFHVSVADIRNKWHGESENRVRMLFDMARKSSDGAIIFVDEIESLCESRDSPDSDSLSNSILSELLVQVNGLGNKDDNLLLLGATNLPAKMDTAMLRRFDKHVYVSLPDAVAREAMFNINLQNTKDKRLTDEDYAELAQLTEGASGSDLKVLVNAALHEPLNRCKPFQQYRKAGAEWLPRENTADSPHCKECPVPSSRDRCTKCKSKWMNFNHVPARTLKAPALCMDDFRKALANWKKTVNEEQLEQYERFRSQGRLKGLGGDAS